MADWTRVTTERLMLTVPGPGDVDELFAIHRDPASWCHHPSLRHVRREQTAHLVRGSAEVWRTHGLGSWVLRRAGPGATRGALVGLGGCTPLGDVAWNLGYRLDAGSWGVGLAQELIAAARTAAVDVRPDLPVVARLLETNPASRRAAERAGLELVWSGPDAGNPDPSAVRLVLADRPLGDDVLTAIAGTGG